MIKYLFLILTLSPLLAIAQEKDDSKYLAGAVPEVNGKVLFSKELNAPQPPHNFHGTKFMTPYYHGLKNDSSPTRKTTGAWFYLPIRKKDKSFAMEVNIWYLQTNFCHWTGPRPATD